ncbi:efflux RND transporter periplasmic adaptor subunit [Paenibacillus glycanilyticus]|uniref:efflux RND transporter periplasmic adaptor subunit n=1 Tax=Paenibacillus glycanilyticus TaxID=126569 RepID=UPI00203B060C|nr:efflux RND transporter periplasmic adaptor subunit [Paenibacillus glycanilyticus]MCM3628189.1 efflux RND transporter periplasmic adaptor subunit [Paenibacillus glycanilyticus]
MERQHNRDETKSRKNKLRLVFILFVSGLLVLTLYSNTLLTMNLTKVWTIVGRQEELVQSFNGSGMLEPVSEVSLSNKAGWTIKAVKVRAGGLVKKGQTLVVYESTEAENQYMDAKVQVEQQQLAIEGLQDRYIEAASSGDDTQLRSANRDLESARLTLDMQRRNLDTMKANLVSNRELKAPFDGIAMKVNAVEGLSSASAGPDVLVASSIQGYQFHVQVPATISGHFKIGRKLDVHIGQEDKATTVEGIVSGMENKESQVNIAVTVKNEQIRGGEQALLDLKFVSDKTSGILVPSSAIHKEGSETFVYIIEERKGPLGNTSHVRKMPVKTGDSNESETVVQQGIFPDSPIILQSSEPVVTDGERVRVMP